MCGPEGSSFVVRGVEMKNVRDRCLDGRRTRCTVTYSGLGCGMCLY